MNKKFIYNHPLFKERRKELRKNETNTENILWKFLRNKQLYGIKFYRQYSIGQFVLDFYCPSSRLAIELDGKTHIHQKDYDKERTWYLKDKDIYILRFWNDEITNNISEVLRKIERKIRTPS